jgi:hypothetical protein
MIRDATRQTRVGYVCSWRKQTHSTRGGARCGLSCRRQRSRRNGRRSQAPTRCGASRPLPCPSCLGSATPIHPLCPRRAIFLPGSAIRLMRRCRRPCHCRRACRESSRSETCERARRNEWRPRSAKAPRSWPRFTRFSGRNLRRPEKGEYARTSLDQGDRKPDLLESEVASPDDHSPATAPDSGADCIRLGPLAQIVNARKGAAGRRTSRGAAPGASNIWL